jgi:Fur family ferric uptake transcriptional regulator
MPIKQRPSPHRTRRDGVFKAPSDADLAAQLRGAGLRRTQPRVAVLRYMLGVGHPVAHAEVATALEKLVVDRVSVYRVLVDLARVGILTRSDVGDHVWRFELQRGDRSHYQEHAHFVCVSCGAVACLSSKAVQLGARSQGRVPRSVRTREVEVQLRGECDACAPA